VRAWGERKIEVRRVREESQAQGAWGYTTHRWMKGAGQAQAVRRYLGLAENEWPVVVVAGNTCVFHFGGARRRAIIELLRDRDSDAKRRIKVNEWFISAPGENTSKPAWLSDVTAASLELVLMSRLAQLERTLARPVANKHLPLDMRLLEVRGWLQLESEVQAIQNCRWVVTTENSLQAALRELRDGISGLRM